MPYVTNGNIYAPVMMVAEKAADLILGDTPAGARAPPVLPAPARLIPSGGRGDAPPTRLRRASGIDRMSMSGP